MQRLCAIAHNAMSTVKSRESGESPSIFCFVSMSIQLLSKLRRVLRLWGMRFGHFGILYLNNKVSVKWGQLQPPMTMVFQVKDPAMLDKAKTGDKIKFRVVREEGEMLVTDIQAAQ